MKAEVITSTRERITHKGITESGARRVSAGTLLMSFKLSIGKLAFAGADLFTNEAIAALPLRNGKIDSRFLWRALENIDFSGAGNRAVMGNTLNKAALNDIPVSFPPLEEQRRIMAILDKADALRQQRRCAIALLDSLTQSIFVDMFGSASSTKHKKRPVSEVAAKVTDGTHQAPRWANGGVPFLFVSNVRNQALDMTTSKYVSEDEYQRLTKSTPIEPGDVLYTAVGSYGRSAVVPAGSKFVFQRHIAHIKPDQRRVLPRYLSVALETPDARKQADALARGNAQKTVPLSAIKQIAIPLPPLEDQQAFVRSIARLETQAKLGLSSLSSLEAMFASLQHRAFSGQL